MEYTITTPLTKGMAGKLRAGDTVLINGVIYAARDAAHARMQESILHGGDLPFPIKNAIIYYMGPTPTRPGRPIGSAGPTTSGRMDKYTPALLDLGLTGMIGKGKRSCEVKSSIKKNNAVYLAAIGGAGALLSHCIIENKIIAYDDLGAEAVCALTVRDFPAIVIIDSIGNDLYSLNVP